MIESQYKEREEGLKDRIKQIETEHTKLTSKIERKNDKNKIMRTKMIEIEDINR